MHNNSISEMMKLINKIVFNLHWIIPIFLVFYVTTPFLAPVFMKLGLERQGWWIYNLYKFLCHQRPERSLFLFGEKLTYPLEELVEHGFDGSILGFPFVGNEVLGYKVAVCVRDVFLYTSLAIAGFIVAFRKKKIGIKWWIAVLMALPMAIDGATQLISEATYFTQDFWELQLANPYYLSNNVMRAVTGTLFGFGVGLYIFTELKASLQYEDGGEDHGDSENKHEQKTADDKKQD